MIRYLPLDKGGSVIGDRLAYASLALGRTQRAALWRHLHLGVVSGAFLASPTTVGIDRDRATEGRKEGAR